MTGGVSFAPRRIGDGERKPARLSVKGTDRILRGRSICRPASVRTLPFRHCDRTCTSVGKIGPWMCASNMNSKPRWAAALGAAAISVVRRPHRRDARVRKRLAAGARHARGSRCLFPQGYRRRLLVPPSLALLGAEQAFESGVRCGPCRPNWRNHDRGRAGCPNATQPEPVTVSVLFIRPGMGNWQVICGFCPKNTLYPGASGTAAAI
jgi:hypothetical protein